MLMNINSIEFKKFEIAVPKLSKDQYMLLRTLFMSIQSPKNNTKDGLFMSVDLFQNQNQKQLQDLLKKNIEITVTNKETQSWTCFHVINDIAIEDQKIFYTPAKIIQEIIDESDKKSQKKSFLKYILFNGIRYKQTLLLIDYILKQDKPFFEISIIDLKKVFELTEDQYKNFSTFRNSVINRVIKEITDKTSLSVKYEITKRERKKIVELSFNYYMRGDV